ncbi:uncharacterized protein VTP21DRAFT_3885 [Calcarisporiella thermophila]|uniref:uncharacterized protein n=1 Tax=Calcarisporiella thermophila TaxID=911321 RepID=UPI00374255C3
MSSPHHPPPPPSIHVLKDEQAVSSSLADLVAEASAAAIKKHDRFIVGITGGNLPQILGETLKSRTDIEWEKWHVFFVDERVAIVEQDPASVLNLSLSSLFNHVSVPESHIHKVNSTLASDPEEMADDYIQQMIGVFTTIHKGDSVRFPVFDLILLGIGPDGHIASLFPGHPLLSEDQEWCCAIVDSPKPPLQRVTMTLPVINHAHHVAFVVTGSELADIVHQTLDEEEPPLPCRMVRPSAGRVTWLLDEKAASHLKRKATTHSA